MILSTSPTASPAITARIYVAQNESTKLEVTDTVFNGTGGNAVAINAGYTPTTTTGCTDNTSRNHNV